MGGPGIECESLFLEGSCTHACSLDAGHAGQHQCDCVNSIFWDDDEAEEDFWDDDEAEEIQ